MWQRRLRRTRRLRHTATRADKGFSYALFGTLRNFGLGRLGVPGNSAPSARTLMGPTRLRSRP
eukprot:scaffold2083_cov30-Tisochrysis_lutea.AAC.2